MKEVARQVFVTLNKEGNLYCVLNDMNYVFKFYESSLEKAKQIFDAWLKGSARERYAVENGNADFDSIYGNGFIEFTYSEFDPYQDANGALYDIKRKEWRN